MLSAHKNFNSTVVDAVDRWLVISFANAAIERAENFADGGFRWCWLWIEQSRLYIRQIAWSISWSILLVFARLSQNRLKISRQMFWGWRFTNMALTCPCVELSIEWTFARNLKYEAHMSMMMEACFSRTDWRGSLPSGLASYDPSLPTTPQSHNYPANVPNFQCHSRG